VTLPATLLRDRIQGTAFAAASDEVRPVLEGVQISFEGNTLLIAATDSFRLATKRATLTSAVAKKRSLSLPRHSKKPSGF